MPFLCKRSSPTLQHRGCGACRRSTVLPRNDEPGPAQKIVLLLQRHFYFHKPIKVFQFEQNHPREEISLSISGERVLFHVETHEVPYQADKSNMNEDEWRAAIKWIEKQEGDGPWVVSPEDDDQKSVSQEDEETLLRDAIESGNEAERERDARKRDVTKKVLFAKNNEIEALPGTASQVVESNTNKDEVLSLVRQFCESSTNMMKQCQESLLGAQAAVAKMAKIQGLIIDEFNKQKDVFAKQTKTLEDKNNEIRKQIKDVNNECSKMHEHYQKLVDRDESRSNGGTSSSELGELKNQVSKLVQQEFKKLKVDRSKNMDQTTDSGDENETGISDLDEMSDAESEYSNHDSSTDQSESDIDDTDDNNNSPQKNEMKNKKFVLGKDKATKWFHTPPNQKLVQPHLVNRLQLPNLSLELRSIIIKTGKIKYPMNPQCPERGLCYQCPRRANSYTTKSCTSCNAPICNKHTVRYCCDCQFNLVSRNEL
ncbi:Protein of unknown function [Cotesia congregata]|uniref:Uncharacterized protein n=1 Tax=Cotesia congregata TaxID=51543 RepID=A0A8J2EB49_COTCN|nr:Protein of unknown function [Cotesia congregata]